MPITGRSARSTLGGRALALTTGGFFAALVPLGARAQQAADTTIDVQTLWPGVGPTEFVAVRSSAVSPNRGVGFSAVLSYDRKPLVLYDPIDNVRIDAVTEQVGAEFLWSYGVLDRGQVGLAIPLVVDQSGAGRAALTHVGPTLQNFALRDLRIEGKVQILRRRGDALRWFGLAAVAVFTLPTGDGANFAADRGAVFAPMVVADYHRPRAAFALNFGARFRQTSSFAGLAVGNQVTLAAAAGTSFLAERLRPFVEYEALLGLVPQSGSPMEVRVGARVALDAAGDLSLVAAVGGGVHHLGAAISPGASIPALEPGLRVVAAITYAPTGPTPGPGTATP